MSKLCRARFPVCLSALARHVSCLQGRPPGDTELATMCIRQCQATGALGSDVAWSANSLHADCFASAGNAQGADAVCEERGRGARHAARAERRQVIYGHTVRCTPAAPGCACTCLCTGLAADFSSAVCQRWHPADIVLLLILLILHRVCMRCDCDLQLLSPHVPYMAHLQVDCQSWLPVPASSHAAER